MVDHRKTNAPRPDEKVERVAFIHIPKTAGVTVRSALKRLFADFTPLNERPEWEFAPRKFFSAATSSALPFTANLERLADFPSFGGHIRARDIVNFFGADQFSAYRSFTIVRDPIDRMLSSYNYMKGQHEDPLGSRFGMPFPDTFKEWFGWAEPNMQCRYLGLDGAAQSAIDFTGELSMDVVTLPWADAYLDWLGGTQGAPPLDAGRRNVSRKALTRDDLSAEEIDLILERCAEDVKLYAHFDKQGWRPASDAAPAARVPTIGSDADLQAVALGGPVFIHGASIPGRCVLRRLLDLKPDLAFLGFIDSFAAGAVGRYPVHRLSEIPKATLATATVLIAAERYTPVARGLLDCGATRICDAFDYALRIQTALKTA